MTKERRRTRSGEELQLYRALRAGDPMDTILVWGAGGHGKVVADVVHSCGHWMGGFIDADPSKLGLELGRGKVIAGESELIERCRAGLGLPAGAKRVALALGDNELRQRAMELLGSRCAAALVHPSAIASASTAIGRGTVVLPHAVINASACVGEAVIVNTAAVIEHDCVIADAAHVSPRAVLAGGVRIGERSWIGAGATVNPGIEVGADAIVGAGAVVTRHVPPGQTVAGVPARAIRRA